MMLVDRRAGSKELLAPLVQAGLDAQLTELPFADVAFVGRGPAEAQFDIGVEFKQVGELVTSLRTGRLAGYQLPGMRQAYDYSWLLVEGDWRPDPSGYVSMKGRGGTWKPLHGRMMAAEYEKHLLTLEVCGGIRIRHSRTRADSVRFLSTLYRWFTDKRLDQHTSHLAAYEPPIPYGLSDFRQTARTLPGVGSRVSLAAEQRFGSLHRAFTATEDEWANLVTVDERGRSKRMGRADAKRIVEWVHKRHDMKERI